MSSQRRCSRRQEYSNDDEGNNSGGEGGGENEEPSGIGDLFAMFNKEGFDSIPKVTMGVILGKIFIYQEIIKLPWDNTDACINANDIIYNHDYKRFFISPFLHSDERHLAFNLLSFMIKGKTLETKYGSTNFALLILLLLFLTNISYLVLAFTAAKVLNDPEWMDFCTIGFSGVCFALKVVTTADIGKDKAYVLGMKVPTKHATWLELIAAKRLVPGASFLAHFAGVVAGMAYISSPLGAVVDAIIGTLTGTPIAQLPYATRNRKLMENQVRKVEQKGERPKREEKQRRGKSPSQTKGKRTDKIDGHRKKGRVEKELLIITY